MKNKQLTDALEWRRAVKIYDKSKQISDEDLESILESGRLAPSSNGFEPWKFFVIKNEELRQKMAVDAIYNQKQVTTASVFIVLAARTDSRETLVQELVQRTAEQQHTPEDAQTTFAAYLQSGLSRFNEEQLLAHKREQVCIALGMMMATASQLGIDNSPMGGFDNAKLDEVLGLKEKGATSVVLLALGHRSEEDVASKRAKVRRALSEVVEVIE